MFFAGLLELIENYIKQIPDPRPQVNEQEDEEEFPVFNDPAAEVNGN